jgi:hypothetical protein
MIKKPLSLWGLQVGFIGFALADFVLVYHYPLQRSLFICGAGILAMACVWQLEQHKSHISIPYSALSKPEKFLRILKRITVTLLLLFTFAGFLMLGLSDLTEGMKTLTVNGIKSYGAILGLMITARWYWRIAFAVAAYFGAHSSLWCAYTFFS